MYFGIFEIDLTALSFCILEYHIEVSWYFWGVFHLHYLYFFLQKVYGYISVFLEETAFAHILHRDTAGSDIGYTTVLKLQACISNIGGMTDDHCTTCRNVFHLRFYDT